MLEIMYGESSEGYKKKNWYRTINKNWNMH